MIAPPVLQQKNALTWKKTDWPKLDRFKFLVLDILVLDILVLDILVLDIPAAWLYGGMAAWLHDALLHCCMAAWRHGSMAAGCQYIGHDIVVQKDYDINIRHRSKTLRHCSKKLRWSSFGLLYRHWHHSPKLRCAYDVVGSNRLLTCDVRYDIVEKLQYRVRYHDRVWCSFYPFLDT